MSLPYGTALRKSADTRQSQDRLRGTARARGQPRRMRRPASSSTAARNRLRSMRGSCRTPSHEYACCTCHSQSWSEFIKTFGISSFERGGHRARSCPRAKTLKCMSKENTGTEQTQTRCNGLNHRKNPSSPCTNTTPSDRAQSKGFRGAAEDPARVMLWHNSLPGRGTGDTGKPRNATSARRPLPHATAGRGSVA